MKSLFLAVTAALALLVSCSKDYNEIMESSVGGVVNVSFAHDESPTRTFFGTTATAEAWEKELKAVTMYVFNRSGNLILQRAFSAEELSGKQAVFALPDVVVGDSYDFYAVANLQPGGITNKASLLAALENDASAYNGTFADVSNAAKRSGGFVMSGFTTKAIAAAGSSTDVTIVLKRTVAKIAIEITPSAAFGSVYPGALRINNAIITKAASQTPVIKPETISTGTMLFRATQVSDAAAGKFRNLFYIYENGSLAAGSRVKLSLTATYDKDGNFSTTGDQTLMSYDVELAGTSAGAIQRNGYYRIAITVNGLEGSDATLSITPAEWETPATQTIQVGV